MSEVPRTRAIECHETPDEDDAGRAPGGALMAAVAYAPLSLALLLPFIAAAYMLRLLTPEVMAKFGAGVLLLIGSALIYGALYELDVQRKRQPKGVVLPWPTATAGSIVQRIRADVRRQLAARSRRRKRAQVLGWFVVMLAAPTLGACVCFGAAWLLGWIH